MTIQQLRKHYEAQPFEPFVIHLADGKEIPVPHKEFLAFSPSGRTITVYEPDDTSSVIDLLLVTRLESKSNGQQAARRN